MKTDMEVVAGRWSTCPTCETKTFLVQRGYLHHTATVGPFRYYWMCPGCGTFTRARMGRRRPPRRGPVQPVRENLALPRPRGARHE